MLYFSKDQDHVGPSINVDNIRDYFDSIVPEKCFKEKEKSLLYLIKSCENYDLNERESINSINKVLGDKSISRRTYYNYKKKLYDNRIFDILENSCYNSSSVKMFILDGILDDREQTEKADKLIGQQFPKRKQVLEDEEKQKEELNKVKDIAQFNIITLKDIETKQSRIDSELPSNHTIREEFVKCGKEYCLQCPHGPYYYAYWKDIETKKLKKKYIGIIDPRQ